MNTSVTDVLELQELVWNYAYCIDVGVSEEYFIDLFTEDALLLSPVTGRYDGADGVRKFYRNSAEMKKSRQVRHVITNPRIEVAGDVAKIRAYLVGVTTKKAGAGEASGLSGSTGAPHTGEYAIVARRVAGRWRMHRRVVCLDALYVGDWTGSLVDQLADPEFSHSDQAVGRILKDLGYQD